MTDPNAADILHTGVDSLVDDAKATEDFSNEVQALFDGKINALLQNQSLRTNPTKITEAIEELLLPLEKKCRQVSDAISCSKLCQKMLSLCYYIPDAPDSTACLKDLNKAMELMVTLSRKRGQLRRVISDIVSLGTKWLNSGAVNQNADMKEGSTSHTALLNTLLEITDGKIFVEVERSRLVSIQAKILEEIHKDVDGAAMLLQETQVETFSTMSKIEKAKFILNQMRLMLLRYDYVRVQIASRKISEKFLEDDDMQEVKCEYFLYMVEYYLHGEAMFDSKSDNDSKSRQQASNNDGSGNFYEVTKCYQKIFNTEIVKKTDIDGGKIPGYKSVLSHWLIYCVLAKNNENSIKLMDDTLNGSLLTRKDLEIFENLSGLVRSFRDKKLISWPLKFEAELLEHKIFKDPKHGPTRFKILRKRVIQYNLKVCSLYYSRISTDRLMKLLSLTQKECETELATLVVDGSLYARIDRPERTIVFLNPKSKDKDSNKTLTDTDPTKNANLSAKDKKALLEASNSALATSEAKVSEEKMNNWAQSIENVLNLVKEAGHLISKERMIQEARAKSLKAGGAK